jgi:methanogenic corrinoid protein MtbC1
MQLECGDAKMIASRAQRLAARVVELKPLRFAADAGDERERYLEDATLHLRSLSDAMLGKSERLFVDYVVWMRTCLAARNVKPDYLTDQLHSLRTVLHEELPEAAPRADSFLSAAFSSLAAPPADVFSQLVPGSLAERYVERLLAFDRNGALSLISRALEHGTPIRELYLQVIQSAQHEIGRLWQLNLIPVAHEHYCTAVSQLALAQLYPRMMHGPGGPRVVATCVSEELHELGARMVADFFELDGWDTTYVGANAPAHDLPGLLRERRASLLAISATMSSHVHAVLATIQQVRSAPDLRHLKILVGGRPFMVEGSLWRRLGADGCAADAQEAVAVGRRLLTGSA